MFNSYEWYDFHTCFEQDDLIGRLSDNTENAIDTDSRVLDAYIGQCTGEAQEGNNLIPIPTTKGQYGNIKLSE